MRNTSTFRPNTRMGPLLLMFRKMTPAFFMLYHPENKPGYTARWTDWRLTPMLMLLYFFANLDRFVWNSRSLLQKS